MPEPSVGGPTRIVMRPDSADDALDRRYVSALADFGVGGDANGGVSAWGDGNDMLFGAGDYNRAAGAGAAAWGAAAWLLDDSDEEPQQDPVAQVRRCPSSIPSGKINSRMVPLTFPSAAPRCSAADARIRYEAGAAHRWTPLQS